MVTNQKLRGFDLFEAGGNPLTDSRAAAETHFASLQTSDWAPFKARLIGNARFWPLDYDGV